MIYMKDLKSICKIAVVQATPIMFDKDKCLEKVISIIEECASNGAEFVVFPELFIPGYPYGMNFGFTIGNRDNESRKDWKNYYDNSIIFDGIEMNKIVYTAVKNHVYVSIGYSERDSKTSTLYNSNMMISPEGETFNHRKLKPTGSERLIWGDANKEYFPVMDTPWGPVGNLICWESYMPLARFALYEKGISIYISPNTNDNQEWQNTIRHIAIEGHCYFINCNMVFKKSDYPESTDDEILSKLDDTVCKGGTCIIDPYGHEVSETLWDKEGIIYADLYMNKIIESRMEFDVCGHYSRQDVFDFKFNDD